MALITVEADSAYKRKTCGNTFSLERGRLLPPCPRCGGEMEEHEGPPPDLGNHCCS